MTWQLKLATNHHQTDEHCLQLIHIKRSRCLRQWFGPMAQLLYAKYLCTNHSPCAQAENQAIVIDKQDAQSFLVSASFFHHQCFNQYKIAQDINLRGLLALPELCELLLYIRMTNHHPCVRQIEHLVDCHVEVGADFSSALEALVEAQLIQKIKVSDLEFYDKNPFPHDHIFDQENLTLKDWDRIDDIDDQHHLISHPLNKLPI